MFFRYLLLFVSLTSFLRDFGISCCDEGCADKPVFTPSRLVVKYGDPTSARCSVCQHCQTDASGLEVPQGVRTENGTTHTWTVDRLTEFDPSVLCHYSDDSGQTSRQCCTKLPVTVYKPPDSVSIHFASQMFEGRQETLNCKFSNVTPVENLILTFYRGQTVLHSTHFNNTEKKPVSDHFNLTITPSKEDDRGQFWCEAKLELGPEGPQPPPVVRSERVTATVHYQPQLVVSSQPHQIVIKKGDPLKLNCTAVGNPTPSYTWTKSSGRLSSTSSVLSINSVTTEDKGDYTCLVSNSVGNVTVVYHVDVTDKPQLVVSSQSDKIVIKKGAPLQLNCTAVGNPKPSYTWTRSSGGVSLSSSSVLTINSVTTEDKGEYTCSVSNSVGTVTKVYHVDVTGSHTGLIIAVVVTVVLLLVVIAGICYYRKKRMG